MTPRTRPRAAPKSLRIPDDLWLAAQTKAEVEQTTVSAEVIKFLRWYVHGPGNDESAPARREPRQGR